MKLKPSVSLHNNTHLFISVANLLALFLFHAKEPIKTLPTTTKSTTITTIATKAPVDKTFFDPLALDGGGVALAVGVPPIHIVVLMNPLPFEAVERVGMVSLGWLDGKAATLLINPVASTLSKYETQGE